MEHSPELATEFISSNKPKYSNFPFRISIGTYVYIICSINMPHLSVHVSLTRRTFKKDRSDENQTRPQPAHHRCYQARRPVSIFLD